MNGITNAYLGDALFELMVRKYLVDKGDTKVHELHKKAINYTKGENQAKFIDYLILNNMLKDNEIKSYKNGRNAHTNQVRKNVSKEVYHKATGFEALIGVLYLENNFARIEEIFNEMVRWLDEKEKN